MADRDARCIALLVCSRPLHRHAPGRGTPAPRRRADDAEPRRAVDDDAEDPRELGALDRGRRRLCPDVPLTGSAGDRGALRDLSRAGCARAAVLVAQLPSEAARRARGGVKRVVLIRSAAPGKTTLAERLARHYGVSWVPEFVRDYAAAKGSSLEASDVDAIARGQATWEDEYLARAAARNESLLIGDTDLLSTAVYAEHYYERAPAWVVEAARSRRPDLYLLLDVDLPWIPDPQRDRGHVRPEMHALFRAAVEGSGTPFVLISGSATARFASARAAIDELVGVTTGE